MAALRWAAAALALLLTSPAGAQSVERWSDHISEASRRFGVPEQWIRRVMQAESGGRTILDGRLITSRAGALGLMQLMPGTWAEMRARHALGRDPHDPRDNILAGTAYLRAMYDRFGYPGLFAAYNAGPQRYAEHLAMRRRLPAETVAYVATVASPDSVGTTAPSTRPSNSGMFVKLIDLRAGGVEPDGTAVKQPSLFVRLTTAGTTTQD